jgi:hypothetical protein
MCVRAEADLSDVDGDNEPIACSLSLALVIETDTTTGMNSMECIVDQARSMCEHCLRDCLPMYHRLSSLCSHNVGTQPPFLPLVCPWELYKHRQC